MYKQKVLLTINFKTQFYTTVFTRGILLNLRRLCFPHTTFVHCECMTNDFSFFARKRFSLAGSVWDRAHNSRDSHIPADSLCVRELLFPCGRGTD